MFLYSTVSTLNPDGVSRRLHRYSLQYHKIKISNRFLPIVGMVVTTSPNFSLYRMVVYNWNTQGNSLEQCSASECQENRHRTIEHRFTFPAASRPTMRIRISFLPNMRSQIREKLRPMVNEVRLNEVTVSYKLSATFRAIVCCCKVVFFWQRNRVGAIVPWVPSDFRSKVPKLPRFVLLGKYGKIAKRGKMFWMDKKPHVLERVKPKIEKIAVRRTGTEKRGIPSEHMMIRLFQKEGKKGQ